MASTRAVDGYISFEAMALFRAVDGGSRWESPGLSSAIDRFGPGSESESSLMVIQIQYMHSLINLFIAEWDRKNGRPARATLQGVEARSLRQELMLKLLPVYYQSALRPCHDRKSGCMPTMHILPVSEEPLLSAALFALEASVRPEKWRPRGGRDR